MTQERYKSALNFGGLTAWYDPVMRWTMPEASFKGRLIEQARILPGHRVLDLGCGTGTMSIEIKRLHHDAGVCGLDGDPMALSIAKGKAADQDVELEFKEGLSYELDFDDGSFDRVISSLMFHHVGRKNKDRTLREVFRVLKPGGELHIADWGKARNIFMRVAFLGVQMLDGFDTTAVHVKGLLPGMIREAGFVDVNVPSEFGTIFGTLALVSAVKPPEMNWS